MKNVVNTLFLLLSVLSNEKAFGQIENPVPGYIVNNQGDTIVGTLNLENDVILAKGVYFSESDDITKATYYPTDQIKAFGFNDTGDAYQLVEHEYLQVADSSLIRTNRFAKLLYDEQMKLYKLGVSGNEYFKGLSDTPPWVYYLQLPTAEFVKLEIIEKQTSGVAYRTLEKYKGKLKYVMRDWPKAVEAIDDTKYMDEPLRELVHAYSQFKFGITTSIEKKKGRGRIAHFFTASFAPSPEKSNVALLTNAFGAGYMLKFYNPTFDNALEVFAGIEYLYLPPAQDLGDLQAGWIGRVPVGIDVYLFNKWKNFQPRLKAFGVLSYWQSPTRRDNGGGGFRDVFFTIGGGVGADVGQKVRIDFAYEQRVNFIFTLGYRLF